MNECLKKIALILFTLVFGTLCIYVLMWGNSQLDSTKNSVNDALWKQATERRLQQLTEENFNQMYDRTNKINRDLNDYQYTTGKRLESIENRVSRLEKNSSVSSSISINNNQSNGHSPNN